MNGCVHCTGLASFYCLITAWSALPLTEQTGVADGSKDSWKSIRVESNTVYFHEGAENDARQVEQYLRLAIEELAKEFDDGETPRRLKNIELAVYLHDKPNELASEATATLQSSYTKPKYTGSLHLLKPSAHSPQSRTSANEPKDGSYFRKVVVHEYSSMLLDTITQEKVDGGWRYYSAPSWFVQGYEEYLGLFCSSEHSRTETYKKYLAMTRTDPKRVSNDFGLQVRDSYVDGAILLKFMHDQFGKERVHKVLKSGEATFGTAMKKELGVGLDGFFEKWREWLAAQPDK